MSKAGISLLVLLAAAAGAWAQTSPDNMVFVAGGTFRNTKSPYHAKGVTLSGFSLGKYEVTQKEWREIMGANPSAFPGDALPVETVSWYDCVDYCNKRSLREGLKPYYTIDRDQRDPANENAEDDLKWTVTTNPGANGYRLPTEAEWEYAAGGGQLSKSYTYSGGDDADQVSWNWRNAGDAPLEGAWNWPAIEKNRSRTRPVGEKKANELGLYDMSGNVREWCWDWYGENNGADPIGAARGFARVWKGGGWVGAEFCGEPSFRAGFEANSRAHDHGFRVCRSE